MVAVQTCENCHMKIPVYSGHRFFVEERKIKWGDFKTTYQIMKEENYEHER